MSFELDLAPGICFRSPPELTAAVRGLVEGRPDNSAFTPMRFRYPVKHPRELLRYYLRFLLTPGENGKAPAADELIKGDTCLPNLARILEI